MALEGSTAASQTECDCCNAQSTYASALSHLHAIPTSTLFVHPEAACNLSSVVVSVSALFPSSSVRDSNPMGQVGEVALGRAQDLKFGIGDGLLRYYLYNWRVAAELQPSQVGLVLL